MKKIKLTEAQYKLYQDLIAEQEILDTVEKTKGGYDVRNLIKEGDTIKGEYKSVYGKWYLNEWKADGKPLESVNKYDEILFTLDIKDESE